MKTKINYIISVEGDKGLAQEVTRKSIEAVLNPGDKITEVCYGTQTEEEVLNDHIKTIDSEKFTHIVIVNDGSTLKESAADVVKTYVDDETTVFLPIVELCEEAKSGKPSFKGFLNSSIWKPYFAESIGTLDLTLCVRGVDLILYGAIIPVAVAQKYTFKTDIKYYSFFEYLSRLVHSEVPVLGIPKLTLRCIKDYELKSVSKEEKLIHFKQAQSSYSTATLKTV